VDQFLANLYKYHGVEDFSIGVCFVPVFHNAYMVVCKIEVRKRTALSIGS